MGWMRDGSSSSLPPCSCPLGEAALERPQILLAVTLSDLKQSARAAAERRPVAAAAAVHGATWLLGGLGLGFGFGFGRGCVYGQGCCCLPTWLPLLEALAMRALGLFEFAGEPKLHRRRRCHTWEKACAALRGICCLLLQGSFDGEGGRTRGREGKRVGARGREKERGTGVLLTGRALRILENRHANDLLPGLHGMQALLSGH